MCLIIWITISQTKCLFFFLFAVRGPLTVVASPIAEHRLRTCRLSGHSSRAQPLCSMRDLPRPGHEPVSPALAGGLSTTVPPGKPPLFLFYLYLNTMYIDHLILLYKSLRLFSFLFFFILSFLFFLLFSCLIFSSLFFSLYFSLPIFQFRWFLLCV